MEASASFTRHRPSKAIGKFFTQQIVGGSPVRIAHGRDSFPVRSPDGKLVAMHQAQGGISLYPADGGQPVAMKGATYTELPIRFANGGKSILVGDATGHELVLTLVELSNGRRQPWKRVAPKSRADQLFEAAPDLKYYTYPFSRYSSLLYISKIYAKYLKSQSCFCAASLA